MFDLPNMEDLILRTEAARRLNISVATLALWERLGRIHPVRAAGGLRVRLYSADEVERLAAERKRALAEQEAATE